MDSTIYRNGQYLEKNPNWHAEDSPFKAVWICDLLARNGLKPDYVVEVGSGSGELLSDLAKRFPRARLEGYDISPQAHAIASPKSAGQLSFLQEDYLAVDTPRADLLMAIDVIEHVEDYLGFLNALRPRGEWKCFHIPLDLSVQMVLRMRPIMMVREEVGHLHYFSKETAFATLRDCGYEIVDWNYTRGYELLPGQSRGRRLLNIPRRLIRTFDEDFAVRLLGGASLMVLAR